MRPTTTHTSSPAELAAPGRARTRRPRRGPTRTLTRLTATVLLMGVLSVPPALLLTLTGNPLDPPATLQTLDALRRPLEDQAVVYLLAVAGWLAWLHLLGCLLVETLQQLRGSRIRTPLPGLLFGANAVLASHLIAALLMSSSGTQLTPAPAAGIVTAALATVTSDPGSPAGVQAGDRPSAPAHPAPPPPRGREPSVAASGAGSVDGSPVAAAGQRMHLSCRVLPPHGRQHDTLWDIAERHLGDGMRWREIYALNEGRVMPDGQRLTRASLIRPGWILHLPSDATALTLDEVPTTERAGAAPPQGTTASAPGRAPAEAPAVRVLPSTDLPPVAVPTQQSAPATDPGERSRPQSPAGADHQPAPSITDAPEPPSASEPEPEPVSEPELRTAEVAALGTLLLGAVAFLAALTRRRKLAARRRPPGVRATRPAPDLLAAERQLRLDARTADDISATLRLALLVAAHERDLRVHAVWQHPDGTLELVLPDHDPAVDAPAPFEATSRGWRLTPEGQRYLFTIRIDGLRRQDRTARLDEGLQASPDPFPALLPVGVQDGSACLVNLEPFGLISLDHSAAVDGPLGDDVTPDTGPDLPAYDLRGRSTEPGRAVSDPRQAIVAAWAQALAGAPWAELTDLYVPGAWAQIVTGLAHTRSLDPLATGTDDEQPRDPRRPHPADRQREQYADARSLEAARRAGIGGADSVRLAVSLGYPAQRVPGWLADAAVDALDPNIVVLLGSHPRAHTWTLAADGTLAIPGVADRLVPLRLDTDAHDLLLRLLEHAEDPPHADPADPLRAELLAHWPPLTRPRGASADAPADKDAPPVGGPAATEGGHPGAPAPTTDVLVPPPSVPPDPSAVGGEPPHHVVDLPTVPDRLAAHEQPAAPPHPASTNQPAHVDRERPTEADQDLTSDDGPHGPSGETNPLLPPGVVEVRILGPLEVHGATGPAPRRQALDVLVHLALHRRRPVPSDELFEAVWPSSAYNSRTLRNRVSEVRGYLPPGVDFTRGGYQLPDLVQTDWQRFQTLAQGDTHAQRHALRLVRGRPFEGSTLDWMHLEGHFAEIEAAIVDLAVDVGQRALRTQQYDLAREACYAGLRGCPYDERLYRIGMEAAAAVGATAEVRELRRRLELILEEEVDDDIQPATDELYRRLETEDELRARRQQRRA